MQRSSIIATVVAAGGVLIAGSVASVAVINAASSNTPESQTVALVSSERTGAPTPGPTMTPAPSFDASGAPSTGSEPLPSLTSEPLPEVPEVEVVEQQVVAAPAQPVATSSSAPSRASKQPKPAASTKKSTSPAVREISANKAVAAVLAGTNGGTVTATAKSSHGGYASWAVTVQRKDGSVITGYVDRATGTVFDWVVNQKAPAATSSSSPSASDDDHESDDDHSGSDHDSDDESDDDHSGSDHDSDDD